LRGEAVTEAPLLGRATRIARVLAKHGLRDRRSDEPLRERARRLRDALEELGPTFAKLGQILSTRPDLLPPEIVEELASLQDRVQPLGEAEVVAVMEEELGVPWEDVFAEIDAEPLAAGTIAQVHAARLETGERVVVKVQRPTARDEVGGVPVREAPAGEARLEAARQLLDAYYLQILGEGFFHADPHPGNLRWWEDRVWFLDFGMVGEVEPRVRALVLLLLLAFW